jgi:hypothetical protein
MTRRLRQAKKILLRLSSAFMSEEKKYSRLWSVTKRSLSQAQTISECD